MKTKEFRAWLAGHKGMNEAVVGCRNSECSRVERYYGDLDDLYAKGEFDELIEQFRYSKDDQRRGVPARHKVPIDGDVHDGSAALKAALRRYKEFLAHYDRGDPLPLPVLSLSSPQSAPKPLPKPVPKSTDWPQWTEPSDAEALQMAKVLAPYVRFLSPDVVRALVNDNEKMRQSWHEVLSASNVDPEAYLWPLSPCAFPGVRRYAGSEEIAIHHGHKAAGAGPLTGALMLDDNDFPKHLWSFVLRGKPFQKFGPDGYSLAHLADHKNHQNRAAADFELLPGSIDLSGRLHGLYTCPTNTAYVPRSFLKPTDFNGRVRHLLIRRAQELYGSLCSIVPPFMQVRVDSHPDWSTDRFDWAAPVGDMTHVPAFLEFRLKKLAELARKASSSTSSA